jgi:hypothetical protein
VVGNENGDFLSMQFFLWIHLPGIEVSMFVVVAALYSAGNKRQQF